MDYYLLAFEYLFFYAIVKTSQVLSLQRKSISLLSPPLLEDIIYKCTRTYTSENRRKVTNFF